MNSVHNTEEENALIEGLRIRGSEAKPLLISNVEPKNTQLLMKRIRFSTLHVINQIWHKTWLLKCVYTYTYLTKCAKIKTDYWVT